MIRLLETGYGSHSWIQGSLHMLSCNSAFFVRYTEVLDYCSVLSFVLFCFLNSPPPPPPPPPPSPSLEKSQLSQNNSELVWWRAGVNLAQWLMFVGCLRSQQHAKCCSVKMDTLSVVISRCGSVGKFVASVHFRNNSQCCGSKVYCTNESPCLMNPILPDLK